MTDHLVLSLVLAVAGLCAAGIVGVALAALVQRRSVPYLLVTLALATILVRTGVGVALMWGVFPDATHHNIEHGLDVLMAGLVIAAVYTARRAREAPE